MPSGIASHFMLLYVSDKYWAQVSLVFEFLCVPFSSISALGRFSVVHCTDQVFSPINTYSCFSYCPRAKHLIINFYKNQANGLVSRCISMIPLLMFYYFNLFCVPLMVSQHTAKGGTDGVSSSVCTVNIILEHSYEF